MSRIRRVSDMLCSAHSHLRDRYAFRATSLDIVVLASSTWMLALTFIDPATATTLTPFNMSARIWLGVLATITFFASVVAFKVDWKGRSDAHKRSSDLYAEVKKEAGYTLAAADPIDAAQANRVIARYDLASAVGFPISESEFLAQKQRHTLKVALSKYLDDHPNASLILTRIRWWCQENLGKK